MDFYLSKTRLIIIATVLLLVVAFIVAFVFGIQDQPPTPPAVSLEFWNVFDDSDLWQPFIKSYTRLHRNVEIEYKKIPFEEYEDTLLEALAAGKGPDILAIHNTWLPRWQDKLFPLPRLEMESQLAKVLRIGPFYLPSQFSQTFVDVVSQDFRRDQEIYALPLYVDTLGLYYNKQMFESEGIALPPATWPELLAIVPRLRRIDDKGQITRAAAALGTARNINRSTDILGLLMMQNGTPMSSRLASQRGDIALTDKVEIEGRRIQPGVEALRFYTNFADFSKENYYTWNPRQDYSIDSFVLGRTAMMFNYSFHIPTVRNKAPYLDFAVAPMPQVDLDRKVNYANYWGLGVSKLSQDLEQYYAWDFIHFMNQPENVKQYLTAKGVPTARKDLVDWQRNDPNLGVFAVQSLTADSWWQPDNRVAEKALADAIEAVNLGEAAVEDALERAQARLEVLIR